jgi:hypothetical protein
MKRRTAILREKVFFTVGLPIIPSSHAHLRQRSKSCITPWTRPKKLDTKKDYIEIGGDKQWVRIEKWVAAVQFYVRS